MLTVNIVGNGNQRTVEATEVVADSLSQSFVFTRATLYKPGGETEVIENGNVFVMNESGATVAKYNFGAAGVTPGEHRKPQYDPGPGQTE